ncbi:MAG: MnhB domain-containing protein [Actinomycetota bacterium]|nr:MnhB domain-containing protein [Actinomycetota bacterium]
MRKFPVKWVLMVICLLVFWVMLLSAVVDMPPMGSLKNPTNDYEVTKRYLERGKEEAACPNIVTAVILNYRGYDTMGEVTVIFTAFCGVLALLMREKAKTSFSVMDVSPVKSSLIVYTILRIIFPFILLFAIYIIAFGASSPGGGFQGGTIMAAAFIIYALVFGLLVGMRRIPLSLRVSIEGIAPFTFFIVGLIGLLSGLNFLSFMLPGLSPYYQHFLAKVMLDLLEVGIGVGAGAIFTSIFFSMQREERA